MGRSSCMHPATQQKAVGEVRIDAEGRVRARSATHELGNGAYTAFCQIGPEQPTRRRVERCRWLRHRLAGAAGEALPHRPHDLPSAGTTSRVSVTSSPSFDSRSDPRHRQLVGAGTTTRSRGRCAGSGCRDGRARVNAATAVPVAARSPSASSSLAVASVSSYANSS